MIPELLAALRAELGPDEGTKPKVYDDATGLPIVKGTTVQGNPSIAIGRNLATRGVLATEIEFMFSNDTAQCESDLEGALPWITGLTIPRQVVVYSLYFNMYLGNVAGFLRGWPNFIEQVRTAQYAAAADNLETSEPWATEVGTRATRLGEMVRVG